MSFFVNPFTCEFKWTSPRSTLSADPRQNRPWGYLETTSFGHAIRRNWQLIMLTWFSTLHLRMTVFPICTYVSWGPSMIDCSALIEPIHTTNDNNTIRFRILKISFLGRKKNSGRREQRVKEPKPRVIKCDAHSRQEKNLGFVWNNCPYNVVLTPQRRPFSRKRKIRTSGERRVNPFSHTSPNELI